MPWSKDSFETKDSETGEPTEAKVKTDDEGFVSDMIHGVEQDKEGGEHGHTWELNSDIPDNPEDDPIGGRDPVDSSGKSIYGDADGDADGDDGDSGDGDDGDSGDGDGDGDGGSSDGGSSDGDSGDGDSGGDGDGDGGDGGDDGDGGDGGDGGGDGGDGGE